MRKRCVIIYNMNYTLEELFKLPRTKDDAQRKQIKYYFSNKPCKNNHLDRRNTKTSVCYQCQRDRGKEYYKNPDNKKRLLEYNLLNKDKTRSKEYKLATKNRDLKRRYGISLDEYNQKINNQQNKCAICQQEFNQLKKHETAFVDHDHQSNQVRGLLCYKCNNLIGLANEKIEILEKSIGYLNKYKELSCTLWC